MTNKEILDGLEALVYGVQTRKTENSITFIKDIRRYTKPHSAVLMKGTLNYPWDLYEHTITLLDNNTYKAEDKFFMERGSTHAKGQITYRFVNGDDAWSTENVQIPVREYMKNIGYTQKMPFWTGKRIAIAFACVWIPIIILAIILLLKY